MAGELRGISKQVRPAPCEKLLARGREVNSPGPVASPLVSVVIPAFNRAGTIGDSLASVLAQTVCDIEVIVVDDGSTDGTAEALGAVEDPRVTLVVNTTNAGPAEARNIGARAARAPWIAFQDSDDAWLPWKLHRQLERIGSTAASTAEPFIAAYCGLLILNRLHDRPTSKRTQPVYLPNVSAPVLEGRLEQALLAASLISTQTLIVRRDVFEAVGGFDPAAVGLEDWELAIRVAQRGPIAFVDEPLVLQWFSPNSMTHETAMRLHATQYIIDKHRAAFAGHPRLLARQYMILSGGYRRLGDIDRARESAQRARRLRPLDPKPTAAAGVLTLLGLHRRGRRAR